MVFAADHHTSHLTYFITLSVDSSSVLHKQLGRQQHCMPTGFTVQLRTSLKVQHRDVVVARHCFAFVIRRGTQGGNYVKILALRQSTTTILPGGVIYEDLQSRQTFSRHRLLRAMFRYPGNGTVSLPSKICSAGIILFSYYTRAPMPLDT